MQHQCLSERKDYSDMDMERYKILRARNQTAAEAVAMKAMETLAHTSISMDRSVPKEEDILQLKTQAMKFANAAFEEECRATATSVNNIQCNNSFVEIIPPVLEVDQAKVLNSAMFSKDPIMRAVKSEHEVILQKQAEIFANAALQAERMAANDFGNVKSLDANMIHTEAERAANWAVNEDRAEMQAAEARCAVREKLLHEQTQNMAAVAANQARMSKSSLPPNLSRIDPAATDVHPVAQDEMLRKQAQKLAAAALAAERSLLD